MVYNQVWSSLGTKDPVKTNTFSTITGNDEPRRNIFVERRNRAHTIQSVSVNLGEVQPKISPGDRGLERGVVTW
jgi:hypothetical protein